MRGTLVNAYRLEHGGRIIPAYAGNTACRLVPERRHWDHPRVCGEHLFRACRATYVQGSSPRMRGTRRPASVSTLHRGIIPAYAGNTFCDLSSRPPTRDHPRVCGEHVIIVLAQNVEQGSSPRMRGTLQRRPKRNKPAGIIPAYAGNTFEVEDCGGTTRDHPRVCGEHSVHDIGYWSRRGSSPRMRGTHVLTVFAYVLTGIIPAYAGNTLRDYSNFVVSKFMSFVFHLV